jgi:cytochrome c oxidase subunit 2
MFTIPQPPLRATWLVCALALAIAGCAGPQSSLAPAGHEADRIAALFWWMTAGAVVVWASVMALAVHAVRVPGERWSPRRSRLLIVGGGAVAPTIVLAVLLVYGLRLLPPLVARVPAGGLTIAVDGEQWWWRVRYLVPGREPIELANEIRLPLGERVQLRLTANDVIHSLWIPSLGGKMDMIPGRTTYLALQPTVAGVYRGTCAEYCGTSHALMGLLVEVLPRASFDRWLDGQAESAVPPADTRARRGETLFRSNGCAACHAVRGTPAAGGIGPDLTHIGSRLSVGAGVLPNETDALVRWLRQISRVKPAALMPSFGMLPPEDIEALAAYLKGLR